MKVFPIGCIKGRYLQYGSFPPNWVENVQDNLPSFSSLNKASIKSFKNVVPYRYIVICSGTHFNNTVAEGAQWAHITRVIFSF